MSVKGDITAMLRADAALGALLDTPSSVWHRRAPSSASYPRVVFVRLPFDHGQHLGGADSLEQPLYEFRSFGLTSEDADAVAVAVDDVLGGYRGPLGSRWCSGMTRRSRRDDDFEVTKGGEHRVFLVATEYRISWKPSA